MEQNLQIVLTAETQQANKSIDNFNNKINGLNNQVLSVKESFKRLSKTSINTGDSSSLRQFSTEANKLKYSLISLFPQMTRLVEAINDLGNLEKLNLAVKLGSTDLIKHKTEETLRSVKEYRNAMRLFSRVYNKWHNHFTKRDKKLGIEERTREQVKEYVSTMNSVQMISRVSDKYFQSPKILNVWDSLKEAISSATLKAKEFATAHSLAFKIKEYNALKKAIKENALAMARLKIYEKGFRASEQLKIPVSYEFTNPVTGIEQTLENLKDVQHEMNIVKESTASLQGNFGKVALSLKTLLTTISAVTLGLLVLGAALSIKWAKQAAQVNDAINDNAEKANMSAQQYQKWGYILQMSGSDASVLQGQVNQLNQRLKGADQGSEAATKGFERLGISVYDASGNFRDSTELFEEAITKLQQVDNTTTRAAIATQIFGRNASELNGVLNLNAEQMNKLNRINNVLGLNARNAAVKLAGAYNDTKDTLRAATQSMKTSISEVILPSLIKLNAMLIKTVAYINIFIRTVFGLSLDNDDEMSGASNKVDNYASSLDGANKKAKELKRTLFGFDELNVLSAPDDTEDTTTLFNPEDFQVFNKEDSFSFLSDKDLENIEEFKRKMEELQGMVQAIVMIGTLIAGLFFIIVGFVKGNLLAVLNGIGLIGLGVAIGASGEEGETPFDKLSKMLDAFLKDIQRNIMQVVTIIIGLACVVYGFLGANIPLMLIGAGMVTVGVLGFTDEEGNSVFSKLVNLIKENTELIKQNAMQIVTIILGIVAVVAGFMTSNFSLIAAGALIIGVGVLGLQDAEGNNIFQGVTDAINGFILEYQTLIVSLTAFIGLICLIIGVLISNVTLILVGIGSLGAAFFAGQVEDAEGNSLFDKMLESINKFVIDCQGLLVMLTGFFGLVLVIVGCMGNIPALLVGLGLVGAAIGIASVADENGESLFDKLGNSIKSAWEKLKTWFESTVKPVFTIQYWTNLLNSVKQAFQQFFDNLWQKVSNFCSSLIDKIADTVRNVVQSIRDAFSKESKEEKDALSKELKAEKDKTSSVSPRKQPARVIQEISNLGVPKLAKGGVISQPTLVQVGEYSGARSNPEIVSPQSVMRETMENANFNVINAIYAIGNQICKTVEDKNTDIYMDGDSLTRKITKKQKEQSRYSSSSMVTIG